VTGAKGIALLLVSLVLLGGCFFRASPEERCVRPQEYQSSQSIGDLRVPADLDTPNQSESMEIPDEGEVEYPEGRPCLEMPPDYFGRPVD
jgi:hypothetical protein